VPSAPTPSPVTTAPPAPVAFAPEDVAARTSAVIARAADRSEHFAEFYRDLHRHPELSYQEVRTAAKLAESLTASGLEVHTGIGGTGVLGILRNGDGPTVLLRGDMDGLPVIENTGLDYASTATGTTFDGVETGVMHACGHDVHTTGIAATADALALSRDQWQGTLMVIGQPAEEALGGAAAMLDDGMYDHFGVPDVVLGQHVSGQPAGVMLHGSGQIMAACAQVDVIVVGRGGHGSTPENCVDPILIAAHLITRLQSVVARETPRNGFLVMTVGRAHAGTKSNIIPDEALLQISVRAPSTEVLEWAINRIRQVSAAEALASNAPEPPRVEVTMMARAVSNDEATSTAVAESHRAVFGEASVWRQQGVIMASEDFGVFNGYDSGYTPNLIPTHFWFIGSSAPGSWGEDPTELTPSPASLAPAHAPGFAPDMATTLPAARLAMVAAALTYL
jgi:amidohydrolase